MYTAVKLNYRQLFQPWFRTWLLLTAIVAAITFMIALPFAPQQCDVTWYGPRSCHANLPEVAKFSLSVAGVLGVLGLLSSLWVNGSSRRVVGKAFGVTYLEPDHGITQRVHGMARQLDLPLPAVGIMSTANAFAVGADPHNSAVVLGEPLVNMLNDEELDAVIGHELGHIAYGDMQRMQRTMGYQRMFVGLSSMTVFLAFQLGTRTRQGAYLGYLYGRLLRHSLFFITELALKQLSRQREYYADAVGAILTSPQAMQGALTKIHGVSFETTKEEERFGHLMFRGRGMGRWFATHPTLDERCRALQSEGYIRDTLKKAPLLSAATPSTRPVAEAPRQAAYAQPSYELEEDFFADEDQWDVRPTPRNTAATPVAVSSSRPAAQSYRQAPRAERTTSNKPQSYDPRRRPLHMRIGDTLDNAIDGVRAGVGSVTDAVAEAPLVLVPAYLALAAASFWGGLKILDMMN